jgi:hypothetical protein
MPNLIQSAVEINLWFSDILVLILLLVFPRFICYE